MTYEEAIKILELMRPVPSRGNGKPFLSLSKNVALDMAIEACAKQIPRTPLIDYYGDLDCMCPTCHKVFKKLRKGKMPSHCPDCGQAILWEE
ncbi:MAG: hypothetical protein KBT27_15710 [Prevotellaceae bacterium]|nr:hypothetical protein [Candidatus Faecinaster equi]